MFGLNFNIVNEANQCDDPDKYHTIFAFRAGMVQHMHHTHIVTEKCYFPVLEPWYP